MSAPSACGVRAKRARATRPDVFVVCCHIVIGKAPHEARHAATRPTARRSARRKSPRRSAGLGGRARRSRCPTRSTRDFRRVGAGGEKTGSTSGRGASTAYAGAHPELAARVRARTAGATCPTTGTRHARLRRPKGWPRGFAGKVANAARRRSQAIEASRSAARDARRLGRSDGLGVHEWSGARPSTNAGRQLRELRRARVRHGGHRQRARAARRLHPLRRHVPHLLRLRAQRAAHGGAHEAALRSSSTRTTRSGSARMDRRTNRSSTPRACG